MTHTVWHYISTESEWVTDWGNASHYIERRKTTEQKRMKLQDMKIFEVHNKNITYKEKAKSVEDDYVIP